MVGVPINLEILGMQGLKITVACDELILRVGEQKFDSFVPK
jgi:hypothetical protein